MATQEKKLYSVKEVLEMVGLSRSTLYRRIRDGSFPPPKQISAGRVAFMKEDYDKWVDSLPCR